MVAADRVPAVGARPREVWLTFGLAVLLHALLVSGVLLVPRFRVGSYIAVPVTYTVSLVPGPAAAPRSTPAAAPPASAGPAPAAPPAPAVRPAPAPRAAPPSEELTLPGRRPPPKAPTAVEPSLRLPGATARRETPRPAPPPLTPAVPTAPTPATAAPAPTPGATASSGTAAGNGIGIEVQGAGAGSGGTVQAYYLTLVKFKIEEAWNLLAVGVPPEASVVVRLRILRSGSVKDIEVVTSSGSSSVDNVAVRAIRQSQPLPPFPNLLSEPSLEVMLRFVMDSARRGA